MHAARQPSQSPQPASPPASDLAARAYRKLLDRQELTRAERRVLEQREREKEERLRWKFYGSIPQKHWRRMSGRQSKVLNEQAQRYGIPCGGPTIDLPALVKALHDFLATNAHKLARDDELLEDALRDGGPPSPALERYREERAALARLDRLEREGQLVPRDEVRLALSRIAGLLRAAGEGLLRQYGPAACEVLGEALDDAEREIARAFGPDSAAGDAPHASDPG